MVPVLVIDGNSITDIPSFYAEINRVFMAAEDWQLGESLDALDDMLYGDYGAVGRGAIRVVWLASERSREALGKNATLAWHADKLAFPETYSSKRAQAAIAELKGGRGQTYFEIILEVFAGHPRIELVLA